jgi:hemerythrin-like metal-binding protein
MPTRVPWEPDYAVGHELIDAQHQGLLSVCNGLAEHCAGGPGGAPGEQAFDRDLERLKALVREHFETERLLLARAGYPELENHQVEFDEFEYLVAEVATAENFDRIEIQRFLALWCVGHIRGAGHQQRAFLSGLKSSD